jgi:hypothetical protein
MTNADGDYSPIAVNDKGAVAIQDGGNSITIDGTVNIGTMPEVEIKNDSGNPIPVNGTVTADAGTGNFTVVQPTASNLNATVVGGTGVSRTPNAIRPTGTSGTVTGTIYSISVANVGAANGTVLTSVTTIKPGEVLNFSADAINNFFTSFAYDATGTEFVITYIS